MTDRERLIELIAACDRIYDCELCTKSEKGGNCGNECIADYLIENGVIVPPCKVGDTVYLIHGLTDTKNIIKCTVTALHITSGKNRLGHRKPSHILLENEIMPRLTSRVYLEEFGEKVFLAREEAEKALVERQRES